MVNYVILFTLNFSHLLFVLIQVASSERHNLLQVLYHRIWCYHVCFLQARIRSRTTWTGVHQTARWLTFCCMGIWSLCLSLAV